MSCRGMTSLRRIDGAEPAIDVQHNAGREAVAGNEQDRLGDSCFRPLGVAG